MVIQCNNLIIVDKFFPDDFMATLLHNNFEMSKDNFEKVEYTFHHGMPAFVMDK